MLIKYGKPMQMRKISRNLGTIRNMIDEDRKRSEECYKEPMEGDAPRCRICGGGVFGFICIGLGKISLLFVQNMRRGFSS